MTGKLSGRTAVMTGATGFEGAGIVKALCEGGMNVMMVTHQQKQAEAVAKRLQNLPGRCAWILDQPSFSAVCRQTAEQFGSVDVLIAGQGGPVETTTIQETESDQFDRVLHHQVARTFEMVKEALPYLQQSSGGRIILMAHDGETGGEAGFPVDNTSDGAVISLTHSLAKQLKSTGITVNCIVRSGMNEKQKEGPEALGAAAALFACAEASLISGQIIEVHGK